jgi:uncharacterized protein
MKQFCAIFSALSVLCIFSASSVFADMSTAQEAYLLKDYKKAMEEYKKEDNPKAYYQIGYMYDHSEGVTQDNKEAAEWYRKAAEKGDARAQYRLGLFYATGTGVDENPKEAEKWYRKSAGQGFRPARDALKRLEGSK